MKPQSTLILLLASACLHAQEAGTPPSVLRVLPLGDPPPFRQIVTGDHRQELEVQRGSLPPRKISLMDAKDSVPVGLSLGRISDPLPLPAGAAPLTLKDEAGFKLSLPACTGTARLALLWRDPDKTWDAPRALVLPDSPADFPAGRLRIVNLLPAPLALRLDGTVTQLEPGGSRMIAAPAKTTTLEIAFRKPDGSWQPVQTLTFESTAENIRTQIIAYRCDTPDARKPAKALVLREPVAQSTAVAASR